MIKNSFEYKVKRYTAVALSAAIAVFLLILAGGIVRATGSGGACPDWPTCLGSFTPPMEQNALLDYLHRAIAVLAALLVGVTAWLAWCDFRGQPWISRSMILAAGLMLSQILLGGLAAFADVWGQQAWVSALHLGLSLLIQAGVLVSLVAGYCFAQQAEKSLPMRMVFRSPFARLSLITLGMAFLLLVSGTVVAGSQSSGICTTWPLCPQPLVGGNPSAWIDLSHRAIVAVTAVMLTILLARAWRSQRTKAPILVASTAAVVLFYAQALLGAQMVDDPPAYLLALHQATAVAVWAALVVQVVVIGFAARSTEEEMMEAAAAVGRKGLAKDFLMLTKPIVVALLLVTTYTGMVIGGQAWPSLTVTFWTLLGGFMAAGGSGAINQYIDRYDDVKMQRTQKRPIPAGRLTPAEGLAFGIALTLASFYLMTAFVNFLAAMLTLAGIIYYVLLYSIFLKKTTVQNIVIGGGAGAIPPLVGWAAATGSLNVPSLFLFAIVFMWTPPHFWALALVRRKDYARAGVPMLPVIRGEKETRWQIFLYTIELVALTMFLPLFGLGGSVYLIGATLLGLWLLYAAWKVWRTGGNKLAWKMYRYSSMYLAFIFLVLMVDRLL